MTWEVWVGPWAGVVEVCHRVRSVELSFQIPCSVFLAILTSVEWAVEFIVGDFPGPLPDKGALTEKLKFFGILNLSLSSFLKTSSFFSHNCLSLVDV